MKLGFILKITNGGESETCAINKQEAWARYASDARSAIKDLQGFDESERTVFLLKFLGREGYLLSVIKARPEGSGRPNDNTAAWIFVPSTAVITASEMESVLTQVTDAISERNGINRDKLEVIFNKEYPNKSVLLSAVGTIVSKADGPSALRYYNGDYTLEEMLGEHLGQAEYAKYKGVFLVDQKSGITISSGNILKFEPKSFISIQAPKSVDGFVASILTQNGPVEFDKEIEIPEGQTIRIEWRKDNYAPIVKDFTAGVDKTTKLEFNESDRKIRIQRSWFVVINEFNKRISNAKVYIDNQLLMTNSYLDVSEKKIYSKGISIKAEASEYVTFEEKVQKYSTNMTIKMEHKVYKDTYDVPVYDGEDYICDAKLTITSNREIKKSPLKGYKVEDGKLVYHGGFLSKLKPFAYGFITCLVLILLYAGAQAIENYEFQFGWPPFKQIETQKDSVVDETAEGDYYAQENDELIAKAVKYLDTNKTWNKDSLENNERTRGLFDELNNFEVDKISQRIQSNLATSQKLREVAQKLSEKHSTGIDLHQGKMSNGGQYNKPSDKNINIEKYMSYLEKCGNQDVPINVDETPKTDDAQANESRITGKKSSRASSQGSTDTKNKNKPKPANAKGNKKFGTTGARGEAV